MYARMAYCVSSEDQYHAIHIHLELAFSSARCIMVKHGVEDAIRRMRSDHVILYNKTGWQKFESTKQRANEKNETRLKGGSVKCGPRQVEETGQAL